MGIDANRRPGGCARALNGNRAVSSIRLRSKLLLRTVSATTGLLLIHSTDTPPQYNAVARLLERETNHPRGGLPGRVFQCSSGLMAGSLSTTSLVACQYGCRL